MKAMKTILVVMAAAGLAMAQTPAANKPKAPASQTVSGTAAAAPSAAPAKAPAKPAATPASKPKAPKAAAKTAKKAVVTAVAKPSAEKPAKPAAAKTPAGKRDPFVNPVVRVAGTGGGGGPMCSTGKRCLMISEMMLRGIVRTQGGMIAVVSNAANRAYFLKENDPVFNGTVVKITGDSVIFKENVVDNLGRESSREVVKRVSAPTV
jgi:Tfp pilus assembly protein PilP